MNTSKIANFIKKHRDDINNNPVQFLYWLYENASITELNSSEEDYLAYSLIYAINKKLNNILEFRISLVEGTPTGLSIRDTENKAIYWYSDCDGSEDLEWLKDLGWLREYLQLPKEIVNYFKQFKIKVINVE